MKFSVLDRSRGVARACHSVSPVSSVAEALDRWRGGDRVEVLGSEFLDVLASVPDPRDPRGRRYPLDGLLAIAILATAAGMGGPTPGSRPGRLPRRIEVLAQLGIRFRRPTEKTFRAVFQRLDPADLDRRLGAYFTALAATEAAAEGGLLAVALDGKTLRGARRAGAAAAHLVSVFAHRARLVLGQLAVAEKSNEIPCVRKILHPFRQVRLLVTVDAMHTQTATAKLICGTLKSHYLMIVKSNQPKLLARITGAAVDARSQSRPPTTRTATAASSGAPSKCSPPRAASDSPTPNRSSRSPANASQQRPANAPGRSSTQSAACHSNTPGRR